MFEKTIKISVLLLLITFTVFTQTKNDSLLKKISEIDVSLNTPVESEENLYLNTVSFQSFYDILSPMGEWIQITKEDIDDDLSDGEGEGYSSLADDEELLFIWKPSVTSGWKPYLNGRWEYTTQGWLWISNDSWGNATYNYGRWWESPKYGWVWLPGYTWSPAWVRWKVSDDHIGWVALSPKAKWKSETGITSENYKYNNKDNEWVFTDYNTFTDEINNTKAVNESRNGALVKNSKNITNIRAEDDMVINNGPDVTSVESKTGKKLGRKKIKFSKERGNTFVGSDEVVLSRESFKKYKFDDKNLKQGSLDRPAKFKKSERAKKIHKKKIKHKKPHRPNNRK